MAESNVIKFNTYKLEKGGLLVDMHDQFNARVGDQGTPLVMQWTQGLTDTEVDLQAKKLHFYATGQVGKYLEKLDDGTGYQMSADASEVEYEDRDASGTMDHGFTKIKLPKQFFPQEGIFYGYFGLKDDQGNTYTSVNIWFRVLGGIPIMGAAIPYFSTRFDELLETCQGRIEDALAELRKEAQDEVKKNLDMSAETRAALEKLAVTAGQIEDQIKAQNIVTLNRHLNDIKAISEQIDKQLSTIHNEPEWYTDLDAVAKAYPDGSSTLIVTDDGYKAVYRDGKWQKGGIYQSAGIADGAVTAEKLANFVNVFATYSTPLILDFAKATLTIPAGYHYIYKGQNHVELPSEDVPIWNTDSNGKKQVPQAGALITYNSVLGQFVIHDFSLNPPFTADDSELYLGWLDFKTKKYSFIMETVTNDEVPANGSLSLVTTVSRRNLPTMIDSLITEKPIEVDYSSPSLTFSGYTSAYVKGLPVNIPAGDYALSKTTEKQTSFFVYAELTKDEANNDQVTVDATNSLQAIPNDAYYLGWIETSWHQYSFTNYQTSNFDISYPWFSKKITCFGDSITHGFQEGSLPRVTSYPHYLAELTYGNVTEAGVTGSAITEGDSVASFVSRVDQITDQDLVTVLGGSNDFGKSLPLGTMEDGENTTSTFYGALKYLVAHLSNNNPTARLLFMTPPKMTDSTYPHTYDSAGQLIKNTAGFTQLDYVQAIKDVCAYYSIPVLDLYNCGPYNPFLSNQRIRYTNDGLHPNEDGQKLLAQTISRAVNNL